ncbi:MAG: aminomethyl-transferring glycine dehydrogenase subunit GcvPB [Verrucomicrobiae bacterium]|nr:aminomethyl-transferring glycine dehydrogenase subunit GcvPB [Verrucomicrobiae bacterium]
MKTIEPLIFEKSVPGNRASPVPESVASGESLGALPRGFLRQTAPALPEVSEIDVVRHFTRLSQLNFSVDTNFYPLGSCTMKYNPKINDRAATLPGFAAIHPYQPDASVQGALEMLFELERMLCEITGMDAVTLQPAAGAHGEFTGILCIRSYHESRGNRRKKVIVPDSSHGTNPSSARLAGYEVVTIPSGRDGCVDLSALEKALDEEVAAIMLTNPNTVGLFEKDILKIREMVHAKGALLYYDGANLNALLGLARPGDMGFDVIHLNLHKSFSTPHGGGGPGAGPVGVKKELEAYLPTPRLVRRPGSDPAQFQWDDNRPDSIGKVRSFYGNFGVLVRAYTYIRAHGAEGLRRSSRGAIINANYLKAKLREVYNDPYPGPCMHEFVLSGEKQKQQGSSARDIAKRLLDFGYHAPTIYWPMIVKECLMIEPTETESRKTLDGFAEAMVQIAREITEDPKKLASAPYTMPVQRMDEVKAARQLDVRFDGQFGG